MDVGENLAAEAAAKKESKQRERERDQMDRCPSDIAQQSTFSSWWS